ncbi:flagellar biosynthetic protein FliO, partial [Rhodopseudomonas sp. B29]|uniref:flagellar biosynthetic protein FliO n=1 Tax=Rhodopseudomonas sp. B29 TaxID=95607 RepID=UPI0004CE9683
MSQTPVMFFFAFIAVLVMIGAAAWLVRRFAGNRLGANANRGRMPRLAVIDAAAVDGRRRLVLVRRDNVEHLLMIGGPSDIVVEPNIVRATPGRDAVPQRPSHSGEPRLSTDVGSWDEVGAEPEPALPELPPIPPRPSRPSFAEEVRRAPPMPAPDRRNDPFAGLVPEPISRPPEPRPELRPEPRAELRPEPRPEPRVEAPRPRPEPAMPRPPRPEAAPLPKTPPLRADRPVPPPPAPPAPPPAPAPSALSEADQNLAEMANRLEAALRLRPPKRRRP